MSTDPIHHTGRRPSSVIKHPSEYSPEVLDVLAELIRPGEHVFDPFAGRGVRLGILCDLLGATFTGQEIQTYPDMDPRVVWGNSREPAGYPAEPFTTVCSPIYLNGISSDYKDGPLPDTNLERRRAYGISCGEPLHEQNLARLVVRSRPDKGASDVYPGFAECVRYWDDRVLVNIDEPMSSPWCQLLEQQGYRIARVVPVFTRRVRGMANDEIRPEHEVVLEAIR